MGVFHVRLITNPEYSRRIRLGAIFGFGLKYEIMNVQLGINYQYSNDDIIYYDYDTKYFTNCFNLILGYRF